MSYLIDSDIMVDLTRGSRGAADYLDSLGDAWAVSMITCLELLAGARTQRETNDLDVLLSRYRAVPLAQEITSRAYTLMKAYARWIASPRRAYRGYGDRVAPDARQQEP